MAQQWIYYKISHLIQTIHLVPANTAFLFARVLFEYTFALNLLVTCLENFFVSSRSLIIHMLMILIMTVNMMKKICFNSA